VEGGEGGIVGDKEGVFAGELGVSEESVERLPRLQIREIGACY
jgi:hypothetical protein